MKKMYYFILLCSLIAFWGCGKSSASDNQQIRAIELSYPETMIMTTFRSDGSISPDIINWDGPQGYFTISSSTEILRRDAIQFDSITGKISWGKHFPLGEFDFSITAIDREARTGVDIILKNSFVEGFFSGGFKMVDFETQETNFSEVPIEYHLWLNSDGTIAIEKPDNPPFSASGTWRALEGSSLMLEFITNLSGGVSTFMKGSLSNSKILPVFEGQYGGSIDENEEVVNPTGIFRFEWD